MIQFMAVQYNRHKSVQKNKACNTFNLFLIQYNQIKKYLFK